MATSATTPKTLAPPIERKTLMGWIYRNLFKTWFDTLLSIGVGYIIFILIRSSYIWLITKANLSALPGNMRLFLVGQYPNANTYPSDQIWRIWLVIFITATLAGLTFGAWKIRNNFAYFIAALPLIAIASNPILSNIVLPNENIERIITFGLKSETVTNLFILQVIIILGYLIGNWRGKPFQKIVISGWIAFFPVIILIIRGYTEIDGAMPIVKTNLWGGLLLSLLLAFVGIVGSFPIGVLLALGRRSDLPLIRWVCIVFIEFIRGVPLITILFMSSVMLQLFLPQGTPSIDRVLRAMVAITLFSAAYLAENVRGGLQSIPNGQAEAAQALGLSGFQTTAFIVLPQAIRAVIPAIVGQFIGLFKDTSLVAIVGLLDLLGIANTVSSNPNYLGTQREAYIFITLIYWVFSYTLSYTSRRIEKTLGVGER